MGNFQLAIRLLRDEIYFAKPEKMILVLTRYKHQPPSVDLLRIEQLADKIGSQPKFSRGDSVFLDTPNGIPPTQKLGLEYSLGPVLSGREFITDIIVYVCEEKIGPGGSWLFSFKNQPMTFYDAEYFSQPALRAAAAFAGASVNSSPRANRFVAGLDPY